LFANNIISSSFMTQGMRSDHRGGQFHLVRLSNQCVY
jgi:hypothetical protein